MKRGARFIYPFSLLILLLLRVPDIVRTPQFWADEGSFFFKDAWCHGSASLFSPYAGYFHTIHRLTALAVSSFPPLYAPALYCAVALALTFLVLALLMSDRLSLPHKPLLALALVMVPHDGEVFANLTNIQWLLAIGLLAVVFMEPGGSKRTLLADVVYVAFVGLTGPFVILVAPLFLAKLWLERANATARPRLLLLSALAVAAAALQMYSVHFTNEEREFQYASLHDCLVDIATHMGNVAVMTVSKIFGSAMQGALALATLKPMSALTIEAIEVYSLACGALFVVVLLYDLAKNRRYVFEKLSLAYFAAMLVFAAIYRNSFLPSTTFNKFLFSVSDRYFYIPKVMLLWILILLIRNKLSGVVSYLFIGAIVVTSLMGFRREPWVDLNWRYWSQRIAAHEAVEVPINPLGWKIDLRCSDRQ